MKSFLSQEERGSLKQQHKKERDGRVRDRIKAILLRDQGWSYRKIADALLITPEAVSNHIEDYQLNFKIKPQSGGSCSKLSEKQATRLIEHLKRHTYLYVKDIVAYVKATYSVEYSISGMRAWLKDHKFSYKKPAVVPGKACREIQEEWIREYYKLKNNLPSDQTICFMDGVHPTHNTKLAYGWIAKGERKEIQTNTGRQRVNIAGAVDIFSKKVLIKEDEILNADSTITFLKSLEEFYPEKRKIHAFCDNARYYKNKAVSAFLETSRVELHFLPPYSPNLNPIERLWKFANEKIRNNKYYERFTDFKSTLMNFFESLADPPQEIYEALTSRVTDKFRAISSQHVFNY